MKRSLFSLFVGLFLLLEIPAGLVRGDGTRPLLTPENAPQIAMLMRLGRGTATSVAWSHDGKSLAVGSSAGIWLYDAADLTAEPRLLEGQRAAITALAFSPDDQHLAAATGQPYDPTVWLWDTSTGQQSAVLQDPDSGVASLAWSPDGKTLATGETPPGFKIRLWDVATGTNTDTLARHTQTVTALAYTPDGQRLVSASEDGSVQGWNDAVVQEFKQGGSAISSVQAISLNVSGDALVVGSLTSGGAEYWDATEHAGLRLKGDNGGGPAVAFSPDGTFLAVADSRSINVWSASALKNAVSRNSELQEGERWEGTALTFEGHADSVTHVVFSPDSRRLASTSGDGTVRVWDVATQKTMTVLGGNSGYAQGLAFSADGATIAVGYNNAGQISNGSIQLWDAATGQSGKTLALDGDNLQVYDVTYLTGTSTLAVAMSDTTLGLWDTESGTKQVDLKPTFADNNFYTAVHLASSPDGTSLAAAYGDNAVRIWDMKTRTVAHTLVGHTSAPDDLAFSPDGHLIASISLFDDSLHLWDVATEKNLVTLDVSSVRALAFSPDGTKLATPGGPPGQIYAISSGDTPLKPTNLVLPDETSWPEDVAYSPDGALIAVVDDAGQVMVWDAAAVKLLATLQSGHQVLLRVAFSPDGTLLAASGYDGVVRLWGIASN